MTNNIRLKENKPLPKRWAWKHGAIYYVVPPKEKVHWDGKAWFRLGDTLAAAHKTFAERLYKVGNKAELMQDLLDLFQFSYIPTLAAASQKYYLNALPTLREIFATTRNPVALIEPYHAYQMVDHITRTQSVKRAKRAAECLSSALSFAVTKGIIKANPLIGQFEKPATVARDHEVSDAHLLAFVESIPRKWQLYIMLKIHCKGRRKGELLRLKRSDLRSDGIQFVNNKRKSDVFIVGWTSNLEWIVKEIIALHAPRVGDAPLFFGRKYKAYIDADGKTSGFDSLWQRYMKKAVSNGLCERFNEHDLRRKAIENETLEQASKLLRHTSVAVTAKFYPPKPEII